MQSLNTFIGMREMRELTKEEQQALVVKMDEIGKEMRWGMVFNELCEDDNIRPIAIHPQKVTNIKRPDLPIDGSKFGLPVFLLLFFCWIGSKTTNCGTLPFGFSRCR